MNLKALKILVKKARTEENALALKLLSAQTQKNTLELILKKNADEVSMESQLSESDLNLLFYFGSYKKSMEDWDDIIKKDLDKVTLNIESIKSKTIDAYTERKKFEIIEDGVEKEVANIELHRENAELEELLILLRQHQDKV